MASSPASLQTLARLLGLSRTTISDALRGTGRVSRATRQRVRQTAKSIGYRPNPLVATVLGSINRRRREVYHGALAVLDLFEPGHWPHGPFPRELISGAKTRAQEMGFSITEFVAGNEALPLPRLHGILRSRGIRGIIVLPAWRQPDLTALGWDDYAGIFTDEATAGPMLHSVCPDHYSSMLSLLTLLAERGYRRPGLILERGRDLRIRHRQRAAYSAWQTAHDGAEIIAPLITAGFPSPGEFGPWFRRYRPDVILSHYNEAPAWVRASMPRARPGFVMLNILDRTTPSAALDLQPRTIGARAVELLVGQLLRAEFGIPDWPSRTLVQARWVEGPTVRPR
ncbi:MAG TPA: LacI family DNA-binding transcriptional regulator [Opitutaceae bacterium]|nr:LacI family DNA-binding transcriptional regulator [Opitutaceae bacterium]